MYSDVKYKKHMLPLFKSYIHSVSARAWTATVTFKAEPNRRVIDKLLEED